MLHFVFCATTPHIVPIILHFSCFLILLYYNKGNLNKAPLWAYFQNLSIITKSPPNWGCISHRQWAFFEWSWLISGKMPRSIVVRTSICSPGIIISLESGVVLHNIVCGVDECKSKRSSTALRHMYTLCPKVSGLISSLIQPSKSKQLFRTFETVNITVSPEIIPHREISWFLLFGTRCYTAENPLTQFAKWYEWSGWKAHCHRDRWTSVKERLMFSPVLSWNDRGK